MECNYNTSSRYPIIKYNQTTIGAHRIVWIYHHGEIEGKLLVCHKCDNPRCINIKHLFLGTYKDNCQDMIKKGRSNFYSRSIYTKEQWEKVYELKKQKYTYCQISKMLKINRNTIISHFSKNKLFKRCWDKKSKENAITLRSKGFKNHEISEILGIPKRSLTRIFTQFKN